MVAWGANQIRLGGNWSSSGDQKGETLWPLFLYIFNAFLEDEPFQDNADLVLGGMILARGAANITNQFSGWHPRGQASEFLAHLHFSSGYDEPEFLRYSNRQFGLIGPDARHERFPTPGFRRRQTGAGSFRRPGDTGKTTQGASAHRWSGRLSLAK